MVSIAITTYNESDAILALLESLVAQTVPPGEVVICDASTDDTADRIQAFAQTSPVPIHVIVRPGANISRGRNAAIHAASGEIIAVTDAGVRLEPTWVERIAAPFQNPEVYAAAGFFALDPHTVFELALAATLFPRLDEIDPRAFAPSSRSVAFRKWVWEAVGGYPEWLDYSEDVVYDIKLRDRLAGNDGAGVDAFPFVPSALVLYRPPSSLGKHWRTYCNYASGDGKAGLWWRRHLVRYGIYLVGLPLLVMVSTVWIPWWLGVAVLLLPGAFYLRKPYRRLFREWAHLSAVRKAEAALWVPLIRLVGDAAKMLGYPRGVLWRLRNRHRPEIHWRKHLSTDVEAISSGPSKHLF